MKAPERDTLPDFRGPMVRFESDQKSDSPRERAVPLTRRLYVKRARRQPFQKMEDTAKLK